MIFSLVAFSQNILNNISWPMKSFLDVKRLSQNIQNISFSPLHVDDTPCVAWPIKIYFLSRLLLYFFDHWSTSCFAWTLAGFIVLSLMLYNFLFWPPQNIYRTLPGNSPVCFGSCPKYHVCTLSADSFLSRVSLPIFGVNRFRLLGPSYRFSSQVGPWKLVLTISCAS